MNAMGLARVSCILFSECFKCWVRRVCRYPCFQTYTDRGTVCPEPRDIQFTRHFMLPLLAYL